MKVATWIIIHVGIRRCLVAKKIEFTLREGINYEAQTLESKTESILLTYSVSLLFKMMFKVFLFARQYRPEVNGGNVTIHTWFGKSCCVYV